MSRGACSWLAILACVVLAVSVSAQVRLADDSDRTAFASWFVFLADAQFYKPTPEVTDCAALVRHAFREALRAHTPEWIRIADLPLVPGYPDVRRPPRALPNGWPLFRVADNRYAEFADAATIIRLNARLISRDIAAARPGDLLFYHDASERMPDHLMVFVGRSRFDDSGDDWVVYHTGPDGPHGAPQASRNLPGRAGPGVPASHENSAGEVRKVRLADLLRHPSPRWRPLQSNSRFAGVFRLAILW